MLNLDNFLASKKKTDAQATLAQNLAVKYSDALNDRKYLPQYLRLFKKLKDSWLLSESELDILLDKSGGKSNPGAYFLASVRGMLKPKSYPQK